MFGGHLPTIVSKVNDAMTKGISADSDIGREIAALVFRQFPSLRGKENVVQLIDDMIPDSLQSKFGFTPQVMGFIKDALRVAPQSTPTTK